MHTIQQDIGFHAAYQARWTSRGYRFVFRKGVASWMPAAHMEGSDIDCTDMSEAEFEDFASSKCRLP